MTDRTDQPGPLTELLDELRDAASGEKISVKDLTDAVENKGLLPIIFLAALITASPLSGIPGVSIGGGIIIAVLSLRMMRGSSRANLPGKVATREISSQRLKSGLRKLRPILHWVDRHTHRRISQLFHRPLIWIPQGLCLISGLLIMPLAFIPFSASVAAIGVCLLAAALLTEDGLLFLIALLPYGALIWLVIRYVL